MKYYFKRRIGKEIISLPELVSYEFVVAGVVSLIYFFLDMPARAHSHSAIITGICFGICAVASAIVIFKDVKENDRCSIYDLIRLIVSIAVCIISFTCIDKLLN